MADPRSRLHWLNKELVKLQAGVAKYEHHAANSTRRISAERKLAECLQRIQKAEALLARDTRDLELKSNPSMRESVGGNVEDSDQSNKTDADHQSETVQNSEFGLPAKDVETGSPDAPVEISTTTATDSTTTNALPNGLPGPPLSQASTTTASPMARMETLTVAPTNSTTDQRFTLEQHALIAQMYEDDEPANEYDIDELVERFTDNDTVYAEYASKFALYPALNSPDISLQIVHAFADFDDISVKTLAQPANRWANLGGSDKICLSSRVAIRRFVDAYKTDRNAKLGPNWVKVLARNEPRFLPEAATTSAPVALAFFRMHNTSELRCRFHHSERHDERSLPDTLSKLTGCAFPPPDTGEKKPRGQGKGKGKGKQPIPDMPSRKPGHLDCGCAVLDALEEWFHYKTARLSSTNPRIRNVFPIQGVISTVDRAALLNAFRSPIHIPLRLRYTGVNGWPDLAGQWMQPSYELELLKRCRTFISVRIHHLENADLLNDLQVLAHTDAQNTIAEENAQEVEVEADAVEDRVQTVVAEAEENAQEVEAKAAEDGVQPVVAEKALDDEVAGKRANEGADLVDPCLQPKKLRTM